ncbi:hypothetical protein WR25_02830 [Diploscapter pachys]|uniref:Uncharacterized protein n=1 Tax=Diploscapter pachys TaxID=2018661 RepID=A0A2A2KR93_9BILA|nr:hypothetical protein WR25_02830 [Diploscapter pachys]
MSDSTFPLEWNRSYVPQADTVDESENKRLISNIMDYDKWMRIKSAMRGHEGFRKYGSLIEMEVRNTGRRIGSVEFETIRMDIWGEICNKIQTRFFHDYAVVKQTLERVSDVMENIDTELKSSESAKAQRRRLKREGSTHDLGTLQPNKRPNYQPNASIVDMSSLHFPVRNLLFYVRHYKYDILVSNGFSIPDSTHLVVIISSIGDVRRALRNEMLFKYETSFVTYDPIRVPDLSKEKLAHPNGMLFEKKSDELMVDTVNSILQRSRMPIFTFPEPKSLNRLPEHPIDETKDTSFRCSSLLGRQSFSEPTSTEDQLEDGEIVDE